MIPHTTITLNSLEQIERLNGLNKLRMDNDEQLFDKVIQNLDKLQQFMKAWFDTHSLEAELFLSKKTNTFPFSVYLIRTTSEMDLMLASGMNGIGRCKKRIGGQELGSSLVFGFLSCALSLPPKDSLNYDKTTKIPLPS